MKAWVASFFQKFCVFKTGGCLLGVACEPGKNLSVYHLINCSVKIAPRDARHEYTEANNEPQKTSTCTDFRLFPQQNTSRAQVRDNPAV